MVPQGFNCLLPSPFEILLKHNQDSQEVEAWMYFQAPPPFAPDTHTHSLETSHSCVTQAGVKTVQRWEDDVMAPRRGTCSPDLDPIQVHTHRGTHTQHTYVHNPPRAHKDTEYFLTRNNTCCPEETAELLCRLLRGSVSQWLAWIRAHSDRIWELRLNMLPKRKRTLPHKYPIERVLLSV